MFIDLTKTPPTEAEIQTERGKLESEWTREKRWDLALAMSTLLIAIGPFFWLYYYDHGQIFNFFVLLGCCLVGMVGLYNKNICVKNIDNLSEKINSLLPIWNFNCEEAMWYCKANTTCEAYRLAVAQQGRRLTRGEFEAMKAWAGGGTVQQQMGACDKLHVPQAL